MRCGIVAVNREGRLVMINSLGAQILGLPEAPAPGAQAAEALSMHPQLVQLLHDSFSMTSLPNRAEMDLHPDSVKVRTIGFTLSMIPGDNGTDGVAMFFKDLTQIEHQQEQEKLRDRLAALGQMAASLAHEIRNPLAAIKVTCSLLKRRLEAEHEGAAMVDKIVAEVRRLNETVTSSLEFVKPLSLDLQHGDLRKVLDESVDVAQGRRGRPDILVHRELPEEMPQFLMDRTKLRQVFENLILNAMEAVGEKGSVTVEAECVPTTMVASIPYTPSEGENGACRDIMVVRVADTGPGISDEDISRVFFPFFTTKEQGSGVGLSTAKKIVDSHGGLIDVGYAPGGGALFTVRLPMLIQDEAEG